MDELNFLLKTRGGKNLTQFFLLIHPYRKECY